MPLPSGFTRIRDSGSSTRFAVTRIFMGMSSSPSSLEHRPHVAGPAVAAVEGERLVDEVRAVAPLVRRVGALEVVPEQRAVVGVRALLDELARLLLRALAAEIGEPPLRDDRGDV